jgi:hypothetical protein
VFAILACRKAILCKNKKDSEKKAVRRKDIELWYMFGLILLRVIALQ